MVLFFNRVRLRYRTGAPILFAVAALLAGCAGAGIVIDPARNATAPATLSAIFKFPSRIINIVSVK